MNIPYLQTAKTSLNIGMNMSMAIAISSSISGLWKLPDNALINRFLDGFIFNYVVDTHIKTVPLSDFTHISTDNYLYRGMFQFDKYVYNVIAKTLLERQDLQGFCKNKVKYDFFIEPCKGAILTGSGMAAFYEVVALEEKIPQEYKWLYVWGGIAIAGGITYYIGGIVTAKAIWSNVNIVKGIVGMINSFAAMDAVHLLELEGHRFEIIKAETIPAMTIAAVSFVSARAADGDFYKFSNSLVTEVAKITSFAMSKMFVVVGMEMMVDSYEWMAGTMEFLHEGNSLAGILAEEF